MLAKPTIRMPAVIDPDIVKIAVEFEKETAQLIEFDQKSTLTGKVYWLYGNLRLCTLEPQRYLTRKKLMSPMNSARIFEPEQSMYTVKKSKFNITYANIALRYEKIYPSVWYCFIEKLLKYAGKKSSIFASIWKTNWHFKACWRIQI